MSNYVWIFVHPQFSMKSNLYVFTWKNPGLNFTIQYSNQKIIAEKKKQMIKEIPKHPWSTLYLWLVTCVASKQANQFKVEVI